METFITQRLATDGDGAAADAAVARRAGFDLPSVLVINGPRRGGQRAGLDYHVDDSPANCVT